MTSLQENQQKQDEQMRRRTESQMASMEQQHKRQLEEVQRNADSRVAALEQQNRKQLDEVQRNADARVATLEKDLKTQVDHAQQTARTQAASQLEEYRKQLEQVRKTAESDADRVRHRAEADMADLKATISRLEVDLMKVSWQQSHVLHRPLTPSQAKKTKVQEIQAVRDELEKKAEEQQSLAMKAEARVKQLENELRETQERGVQVRMTDVDMISNESLLTRVSQGDKATKKAEEEKKATQNELDDLLMVFGDLEEKVAKYKVCQSRNRQYWSLRLIHRTHRRSSRNLERSSLTVKMKMRMKRATTRERKMTMMKMTTRRVMMSRAQKHRHFQARCRLYISRSTTIVSRRSTGIMQ